MAKIRHLIGRGKATYEQIGAAWINEEDHSVFVKLNGTQIISDGFMLYPLPGDDEAGATPPTEA